MILLRPEDTDYLSCQKKKASEDEGETDLCDTLAPPALHPPAFGTKRTFATNDDEPYVIRLSILKARNTDEPPQDGTKCLIAVKQISK